MIQLVSKQVGGVEKQELLVGAGCGKVLAIRSNVQAVERLFRYISRYHLKGEMERRGGG